jgi:hypothetical protein
VCGGHEHAADHGDDDGDGLHARHGTRE